MSTPSSSSLSHALNLPATAQKSQADLPRLQLAPPEHQKHFQTPARVTQPQETAPQAGSSAPQRRQDDSPTSLSPSREVSPTIGVETTQPVTGEKRKPLPSKNSSGLKRRRADQAQEELHDVPPQYGASSHYPLTYAYPGMPPPPTQAFHPPPAPSSNSEMGFNEFQWRLLNLCGEFYEAATELIRATPHTVLSQAFQLFSRGTGLDPISVLNDARRTCDMLLLNPQVLSAPPPPPVALSLPILTSLAHLNSRASMTVGPSAAVPTPSYYPPHTSTDSTSGDRGSYKIREKERPPSNVQGTWKDHEIQRLKALAEKYRIRDNVAVAEEEEEEDEDLEDGEGIADGDASTQPPRKIGDVDWDKVIAEFGDERSRHQVLIKATHLGLKPSSTFPGKNPKKKRVPTSPSGPPAPTLSSGGAVLDYSNQHPPPTHSPSASPGIISSNLTGTTAPHPSTAASASGSLLTDPQRGVVSGPPAHTVPPPQLTHALPHAQYPQASWYPHPQNPYYPYHHPMYYPAHPQTYGMQGYSMHAHAAPQQGYYGQPYVPLPPSVTETPTVEKQAPAPKAKRKEPRKSNGSAAGTSQATGATVVPPPSAPPKPTRIESSSVKASSIATAVPLHTDRQGGGQSTPKTTPAVPSTSAGTAPPMTAGSSGVLRRGPSNSLFTYTPLPHGAGGPSAEQ